LRSGLRWATPSESAYRATSFTFLTWLVALEAYKLANKNDRQNTVADDTAAKSHDEDTGSASSRLDEAQDARDAEVHPEQLAKLDDTTTDKLRAEADLDDYLADVIGSSTDPRILAAAIPPASKRL
jgi:hypothetical protein